MILSKTWFLGLNGWNVCSSPLIRPHGASEVKRFRSSVTSLTLPAVPNEYSTASVHPVSPQLGALSSGGDGATVEPFGVLRLILR